MLEERRLSAESSQLIRKVRPTRQVACNELMIAASYMTVAYAGALRTATRQDLLVDGNKPRKLSGVSKEQTVKMERRMSNLQGQYRLVEQSCVKNVLAPTLVRGYLVKLLGNAQVAKFLRGQTSEILEQFETIAARTSLEG